LADRKLLFWGLLRFILVIVIAIILSGIILAYHADILNLLWHKPQSQWVVWLWYLLSWVVSLFLVGISAVVSYILSQILFSVLIMDHMSRLTEKKVTGHVLEPKGVSLFQTFLHLIRQEIPRTVIPITLSLIIMVLSWFVPFLGPVMVFVSSGLTIIFLSWDNTDLIQARRLVPFKKRWAFLSRNILFHVGFGLPFLVPLLNLVFLSYAPVGATLYYLERHETKEAEEPQPPPLPSAE